MRLAQLVIFTKKFLPTAIGIVVLLALAVTSSFSKPVNGESNSSKVESAKNSNQTSVLSETSSEGQSTDSQGVDDEDSTSDDESDNTSVHVSINSNTTNDETTGSAKIEVTENGETETITKDMDPSKGLTINLNGQKIEIGKNGSFKSSIRIRSRNSVSSSQESSIESSQH